MEVTSFAGRSVGSLVAENYARGAVLKRFGIDFCCGGKRTLEAACRASGHGVDVVEDAIRIADLRGAGAPDARVDAWSPAFLADYIVNEHHTYVRQTLPVLRSFTEKLAHVHGHAHPELVSINTLVAELAREMTDHMRAEEEEVFPAIRAGAEPATLRALIGRMEDEHDRAGALMRRIRELSGDFAPPDHACATYRAAYALLEEFEHDLHRHVHLENNVLFEKAGVG